MEQGKVTPLHIHRESDETTPVLEGEIRMNTRAASRSWAHRRSLATEAGYRGRVSEKLTPGDPAPDFDLTASDGSQVSLSDLKGKKAIVYFYPKAMTPGCTTQAIDFQAADDDLRAAGYAVVGISPDAPAALTRFAEQEGLGFPLLSDPDRATLEAYGAWGEKQNYGKTITGVIRSTVVLDADGRVEHAFYNVKATGHVAKLRRDLGLD